jgi:hypothetical protein
MKVRIKLFLILLSAGLAGVFSFLLVDLAALVAVLPMPAGTEIPPITSGLKILSLIQPSIILFVAVWPALRLRPRSG